MLKRVKVEMTCIATVMVDEDIQGNQEIVDVEDVEEVIEFEVKC